MTVYIRRKVTHRSDDPRIKRTSISQVPTETHARSANPAIAGGEFKECGDRLFGIFVVGSEFLRRII